MPQAKSLPPGVNLNQANKILLMGTYYADDLMFMVNEGGVVSCVEAKNGNRVWRGRIIAFFG